MSLSELWHGLAGQLVRLSVSLCIGLVVANLIEALNWTRAVARLAAPIIRLARLRDVSGAAFSLAFFSGAAANAMLAEAHEQGRLSRQELMLSNLFNSLPTYFLHLPTMFFTAWPFLGRAAFLYVGMTLLAAWLRTSCIIVLGRLTLPRIDPGCVVCRLDEQKPRTLADALHTTWRRFRRRIGKILTFSLPIYVVFFMATKHGAFKAMEGYMAANLDFLSWLPPQAMSVVVFHIVSEFSTGLAAAGALLQGNSLPVKTVVLALLVGNVLSSPMRAFRHQFPFYAGIFKPALAARLILYSQGLRMLSVAAVTVGYYFLG